MIGTMTKVHEEHPQKQRPLRLFGYEDEFIPRKGRNVAVKAKMTTDASESFPSSQGFSLSVSSTPASSLFLWLLAQQEQKHTKDEMNSLHNKIDRFNTLGKHPKDRHHQETDEQAAVAHRVQLLHSTTHELLKQTKQHLREARAQDKDLMTYVDTLPLLLQPYRGSGRLPKTLMLSNGSSNVNNTGDSDERLSVAGYGPNENHQPPHQKIQYSNTTVMAMHSRLNDKVLKRLKSDLQETVNRRRKICTQMCARWGCHQRDAMRLIEIVKLQHENEQHAALRLNRKRRQAQMVSLFTVLVTIIVSTVCLSLPDSTGVSGIQTLRHPQIPPTTSHTTIIGSPPAATIRVHSFANRRRRQRAHRRYAARQKRNGAPKRIDQTTIERPISKQLPSWERALPNTTTFSLWTWPILLTSMSILAILSSWTTRRLMDSMPMQQNSKVHVQRLTKPTRELLRSMELLTEEVIDVMRTKMLELSSSKFRRFRAVVRRILQCLDHLEPKDLLLSPDFRQQLQTQIGNQNGESQGLQKSHDAIRVDILVLQDVARQKMDEYISASQNIDSLVKAVMKQPRFWKRK